MRILAALIEVIREHAQRQPHPAEAQIRAEVVKEYRRALLHRPWWWRLIGRDHIKRR